MKPRTDKTIQSAASAAELNPSDAALSEKWFSVGKLMTLIGLFLFMLYPEVVMGSHSFYFRDFGLFGYPLACYCHECFWRGELPLWNPLSNCGLPFLAQWNTLVCYPFSLLYLLGPLPWSLNLFCLGHLLLAGAGMYRLAQQWTGNRFAASVAGLAYALNGLTLHALMWPNNVAALGWMPWVILLVEQSWQTGGRRLLWAAAIGALQMLAGAPEIIFLTWLMLAAMWIGQACHDQVPWRLTLLRFPLVAVLVLGLTAIQMLPFLDLLSHSQPHRMFAKEYWAMPLWGWANFLVPLFHCAPSILGGVATQLDQQWTSSYYLGIGTVALALLAMWRVAKAQVAFLTAMAMAGLILALGEKGLVYDWIKWLVPAVGFMRFPIKLVMLPVFALPLLAALGLDWFQRSAPENAARAQRSLIIIGFALLLLIVGILGLAYWFPLPDDSWRATWRSGATRAVLLALMVAALLGFINSQSGRRRRWIGLAVLVLVGVDALTHAPRQNPTVSNQAYGPLELNMASRPKAGESRAMVSPLNERLLAQVTTSDPLNYCSDVRRSLYANCNLIDGVPKVNGFYALYLKEEGEVRALIYNSGSMIPEQIADFLGVAQISAPDIMFAWQTRPGFMPLMSAGQMPIFGRRLAWQTRPGFMPLVSAGQKPIFASEPETLKALTGSGFDGRGHVYLPPEAREFITVSNRVTAKTTMRDFGAHRIKIDVEAAEASMVVVAQAFYHPWRAYVDGKPTRLWRANHAFQALEVPQGRHEVTLVYEDRIFWLGAAVSLVTLGGCVIAWLRQPKVLASSGQ